MFQTRQFYLPGMKFISSPIGQKCPKRNGDILNESSACCAFFLDKAHGCLSFCELFSLKLIEYLYHLSTAENKAVASSILTD